MTPETTAKLRAALRDALEKGTNHMNFIAPLPNPGRIPLSTPTIRRSASYLSFSLPAKTVAQMGWVKGDRIEVGYENGVFGLRRANAGFALFTSGKERFGVQLANNHVARLGLTSSPNGSASVVRAENGVLLLGEPVETASIASRHEGNGQAAAVF